LSRHIGSIRRVDLRTPDAQASRSFYDRLLASTTPSAPGAAAFSFVASSQGAGWTPYVGVRKMGLALERVWEAGGRALSGPFPTDSGGWSAVAVDPDSHVFGLWEDAPPPARLLAPYPPIAGALLSCDDAAAAAFFYSRVFGWAGDWTGSAGFPFAFVARGAAVAWAQTRRGGLGERGGWRPVFAVADAAAVGARGEELGGRAVHLHRGGLVEVVDPYGNGVVVREAGKTVGDWHEPSVASRD